MRGWGVAGKFVKGGRGQRLGGLSLVVPRTLGAQKRDGEQGIQTS